MITCLDETPKFKWYVIRCGSNDGVQNDTCVAEIRLHAQNMINLLVSILNIIGKDIYDHSMSTRIFTFTMNKVFT